jgi:excisionase family DNA binding protein
MSDMELLEPLKLSEVAAELRSTVHFVRTLIATKELKIVKVGKEFRVTRADLNHWIQTARGYIGEGNLPRTKGKERVKPPIKVVKSA